MKQTDREDDQWKGTAGRTRRAGLGGMLVAAVLALTVIGATPLPASANEPVVRFTPPSLVFGAQPVGQLSSTLTARIENFGTAFGPSTATGVVLTEQLPAESKFVSYKTSNGTCAAPAPGATGTLTCQLGSLPVGSTSTDIVVKVVAPGSTSVTNTATVTSTSNDPNPSNNSATVRTAVFGRK